MANRGWVVACAIVFVLACKKSETKPVAAGSGAPAGSAATATGSGSATVVAAAPPADAAVPVDAAEPYKVGEAIWSLWDDGKAHHGKIKRINADGSFRISWDETDDSDWPANLVSRTKPTPPAVTGLAVGDRVDGLWSDNRWYPGKVGTVNADGTYLVNFDDGDKAALDGHHVRRRKESSGGGSSKAAGGKPCNEGNYYTRCDEYHCFNLNQDDNNCGACGHKCSSKHAPDCVTGECKCVSAQYDNDGNCL